MGDRHQCGSEKVIGKISVLLNQTEHESSDFWRHVALLALIRSISANNVAVLALSYACGEIDGDLCARCVRESSHQCGPGCRERLSDVLRHSPWREGAPKGPE